METPTIVSLIVITVVVALANERIVELLIPIFAQAGFAKLAHEVWKRIGWVTQANQVGRLAVGVDRG